VLFGGLRNVEGVGLHTAEGEVGRMADVAEGLRIAVEEGIDRGEVRLGEVRHMAAVEVVDNLVAVVDTDYERVGHTAAAEAEGSPGIGLEVVDHVVGDILRVGHALAAEVGGRRSLVEVGSLVVAAAGNPEEDTAGVGAADSLGVVGLRSLVEVDNLLEEDRRT